MTELSLESLAVRVSALEQEVAAQKQSAATQAKDWRRVLGNSEDNEFTRAMLLEIEARSEAERQAAQEEQS